MCEFGRTDEGVCLYVCYARRKAVPSPHKQNDGRDARCYIEIKFSFAQELNASWLFAQSFAGTLQFL